MTKASVDANLDSFTSAALPWVSVNPLTGAVSSTPGTMFI